MEKIAVSGIVHYRGKVLVCRRPSFSAYPNLWEFPTEPLEDDETLEDAVERLFFERLTVFPRSITVKSGLDLGILQDLRLYVAEVELKSHYLNLYGYSGFKWLDARSIKKRCLAPTSVILVKNLPL